MRLRGQSFDKNDSNLNKSFFPLISTVSYKSITLESDKQNQKYKRTIDLLQKSEKSQLSKIKKIKDSKLNLFKFDKIIENLDVVVSETLFPSKRLRLLEDCPVKGYIEENSYQEFEIFVWHCCSPLHVKIEIFKGKIESFISFKNSSPDKLTYEKMFSASNFDIFSLTPIFTENICYLSVFAVKGSSIKIEISFGGGLIHKRMKSPPTDIQLKKEEVYKRHIRELRENPILKLEFYDKVKKIIIKRKKNNSQNFIEKNKTIDKAFYFKTSVDEKIKKVQEQRSIIEKYKSESRLAIVNRRDIRDKTDKECEKVRALMWFRQYFEENWVTIIYFIKISMILKSQLLYRRNKKLNKIFIDMQANKIKRAFQRTFTADFSLQYRNIAISRNSLLLFSKVSKACLRFASSKSLIYYINCSSSISILNSKIDTLIHRMKLIQRYWKSFKLYQSLLFDYYFDLWDSAICSIISQINQMNIKMKRKKKSSTVERLSNIPENIKISSINKFISDCKFKILLSKPSYLKSPYPKTQEHFKGLILEALKERTSIFKRSSTIFSKKLIS